MLRGFRTFIMRGNVIDLAVGIVIGAAFSKVVDQLVASFINPLVRVLTGGKRASGTWDLGRGLVVDWGAFINAVLTFLITAAALYFLVVEPMNRLSKRQRKQEEPPAEEEMSDEVRLLTEIRDVLVARGTPPG